MSNQSKKFDLKTVNTIFGAPTAKSGIFTTGANSSLAEEMSKSCIPHIPGSSHKVDLARNPEFVIVFQTMQIERLSLEIESLRVNLKDRQIQMNNYYSYEVQIKELTDQCHELEEQLRHYQNELQKMSLSCNALVEERNEKTKAHQNEVQLLNRKYNSVEDQYQNEIDNLKGYIQQLQDAIRQKEINDKQQENKNKLAQQELVRLNQNLFKDQNELNSLRVENAQRQKSLQKCMEDLRNQQEKLRRELQKGRENENNLKQLYNQNKEYERVIDNLHRDTQRLQRDLNEASTTAQTAKRDYEGNQQKVEEYRVRLDKNNQDLDNYKQAIEQQRRINDIIRNDIGNLQRAYDQVKNELNHRDNKILELIKNSENLANELSNERRRCEDIAQYAVELNERIQYGLSEISRCKEALLAYDQQIKEGNLREQQLQQQLEHLQPIIKANNDLQEELCGVKQKLNEKEEELYAKESHITDLTIENKELYHQGQNLQNNMNILNENLRQLENLLDSERTQFQNEKKSLTDEFNRIAQQLQEENNQITTQLKKLKEEGLIHQSTKTDLRALKEICEAYAQQIINLNSRLQKIQTIITKLKQINQEHIEIERANQTMREQLVSSVKMNETLIDQIGAQIQEISKLHEEIWELQEKLSMQKDKNDDFFTGTSEKTLASTQYSKPPLGSRSRNDDTPSTNQSSMTLQTNSRFEQLGRPSSKERLSPYRKLPVTNNTNNDRFSPTTNSNLNSYNTYSTYTTRYSEEIQDERSKPTTLDGNRARGIKNNLVGGLASMGRDGYYKSTIIGEGPLVQSKRILQSSGPTSYYPPLQSKNKFNGGEISQRTSSYQKFKREFKPFK